MNDLYHKKALLSTPFGNKIARSGNLSSNKEHFFRLSAVSHLKSLPDAPESRLGRNKGILAKQIPQTAYSAPQRPHRTGIEVDLRLPPPESEHLRLRTVRKATGRQSLPPSSRFSIPRIRPRLGFRKKPESTKKKSKHTGTYDTPTSIGEKWQMDVKYVPNACYSGKDGRNSINIRS